MKTLRLMKKAAAPLLAAVLVLGASVSMSGSYFTTYVTARGGYTLDLEASRVQPNEEVDANVKSVTVENTGTVPCYVRARVVSSGNVPVTFEGSDAGWSYNESDQYWYYSRIVEPGASTGVLKATIALPESSPTKPIPEGTEINVVVLAESTKVLYDEAGNAKPNGPGYEGWALEVKEG